MHSKTILIFIGLAFACILNPILCLESITLEIFLKQLKANHPYVTQQLLEHDINDAKRSATKGSQDWLFNASASYLDSEPMSVGFQQINSLKNNTFKTHLNKQFWLTGGTLSLGVESNLFKEIKRTTLARQFMTQPLENYTESKTFVSYTQPLFQNLGGRLFRFPYEQASLQTKLRNLESNENIERFLTNMSKAFIDWRHSHHQKNNAQTRLSLAKQSYQQSMRRFKANVVEKLDVLRASAALNLAKQNLLLAESNLIATTKELSLSANIPELQMLKPELDVYQTKKINKKATLLLLKQTRFIKQFDIQEQLLKKTKAFYLEKKKPNVSLSLYASLSSYDENLAYSFLLNYNDYQASLTYAVPLGETETTHMIQSFKLQELQLKKSKNKSLLALEGSKEALLTQINYLEKIISLNKKQVSLAQQVTQEELRLYNQGRTTIFQVIEAQDQEQQTKLNYLTNAKNYQHLVLEFNNLFDLIY